MRIETRQKVIYGRGADGCISSANVIGRSLHSIDGQEVDRIEESGAVRINGQWFIRAEPSTAKYLEEDFADRSRS